MYFFTSSGQTKNGGVCMDKNESYKLNKFLKTERLYVVLYV